MKSIGLSTLLVLSALWLASCDTNNTDPEPEAIYPMYVDNNANGINDYVEESTHEAGSASTANKSIASTGQASTTGGPGHAFVDENGDGICDYAQDGSPTWHGPGFVDDNGNGVCDYWDTSHPMHSRHQGMHFIDENDNNINDYFEEATHMGDGHNFVDANGDGICDLAQDGSPTWHGPGFVDQDDDGVCDYWQEGGMGHGHGQGGMMGGGPQ